MTRFPAHQTLATLILSTGAALAAPTLKVQATVTGACTVKARITTLPDGVFLSVRLKFCGARGSDPALGTKLWRAKIKNGQASLTLDERQASTSLPKGTYDLTVFSSSLRLENQTFFQKDLKENVKTSAPVTLQADGLDSRAIRAADSLSERVWDGYRDHPIGTTAAQYVSYFQQYGAPEVIAQPGGGRAYYFPKLDLAYVVRGDQDTTLARGRIYHGLK
ncbi:hypothetical protein [Deinococcus arcticus]|uniref:Uncharacterized protein n=1 Tax=Deinococcus arcticus TaxID=2136176 RepID=A0A2T3W3E6_9DEIO|nr:hypothetical protein [Deinococcus arcticus]PTA66420.1 hypothetical protein C8263_18065 [Deinococcus arcticus]